MQALAGRPTVDGLLAIMHKAILHISQQRKRPCKELKKIQNKNMLHFFLTTTQMYMNKSVARCFTFERVRIDVKWPNRVPVFSLCR